MKKTKHFNISVPELGDTPDITQVSNAISDLEDATAGTLEIMKAEMQGTKITLTSVSRKTKRTGYYEGMSIRFKSPQDIESNYLKTISVDGLGDQTLSVEYKVNRNEYIDIIYEENKFTAYPVVVQKTDSVSNNSSILVGTAKAVKTAYDKGVEALNKANQAQSSADRAQSTADSKVSKSGDTMTGNLTIHPPEGNSAITVKRDEDSYGTFLKKVDRLTLWNSVGDNVIELLDDGGAKIIAGNLRTRSKEVIDAINELFNGKEDAFSKKSGFNLDKTDSYVENNSNKLFTAKGAYNLKNEVDTKVSKSGDTMTGDLRLKLSNENDIKSVGILDNESNEYVRLYANGKYGLYLKNMKAKAGIEIANDGSTSIDAKNLKTSSKEVISAINEINKDKVSKSGDTMTGNLTIHSPIGNSVVTVKRNEENYGTFLKKEDRLTIWNSVGDNVIELLDNGDAKIVAGNLNTSSKEVITAINEVNNNVNTKLSKNDFAGNPILWSGASYNVTATLPGDVQSLNDVLYIQVFGANDNACIDGNFLQSISNGTTILLGYVQGGVDQILRMTKIDNRNFRFDVEGSGYDSGGADQTNKIKYIVLRRI